MKSKFVSFPITDFAHCKKQMLNWANRFNICCFLDNHHYDLSAHRYECILGAGVKEFFSASTGNALNELKAFTATKEEWMFGHFAYDLKNELEALQSNHTDHLHFPDLFFFIPETVLILEEQQLLVKAGDDAAAEIFRQVMEQEVSHAEQLTSFDMKSRFNKTDYISIINVLKKHILAGDCYEINFCQEFYQEHVKLQPLSTYELLTAISPNPFAGFYKLDDKYLLCASPERYLWKQDDLVISQPIKGTSKRHLNYGEEDNRARDELKISSKNRSENVMVVDLVRNDLSKICEEGTVRVDELYAVYSFPQVHQMISTISGHVDPTLHWTDCIRATFPMGSMTGAPKKRVMELIERYEKSRRGLFSGSIGYVTPEGNFDFNVVIRSILYNASEEYLSYQVGSGITFYSDAEEEYEECLLKAEAIKKVLT